MEKLWLNGNLSDNPFPYVLYRIWNSKRTGRLEIKTQKHPKKIDFFNGDVTAFASSWDQRSFAKFLHDEKKISSTSIKKCEKLAQSKQISLFKSITELNALSSLKLWSFLKTFMAFDLFPLFDQQEAEFFFDPTQELNESEILASVSTIKVIKKGIYQMKNQKIIDSQLPAQDQYIHQYPNKSFLNKELNPNEKYLLNLIGDKMKRDQLYQHSEIGQNEVNRLIYLFSCLRIAGPPHKALNHLTQELSKVELNRLLDSFNQKCVCIFKYISKEIGPVALSVLEKCIKDIKPHLPPQLQNIRLSQDGTVHISSTPSTNPGLPGEIKLKLFLNALNEILAAEVLAVKKTLGDDHESRITKNLKNIGKWNSKKTKS
ncbi:MAG: DUF4388 domain-containing protein [Candidatus Aminicenantes bacterium]|nr:DUF4388 domain-containing protein [Candidatus Aminicenantes bacterium]